jgi:hypothetical protein
LDEFNRAKSHHRHGLEDIMGTFSTCERNKRGRSGKLAIFVQCVVVKRLFKPTFFPVLLLHDSGLIQHRSRVSFALCETSFCAFI